jgi:hypothetical protein
VDTCRGNGDLNDRSLSNNDFVGRVGIFSQPRRRSPRSLRRGSLNLLLVADPNLEDSLPIPVEMMTLGPIRDPPASNKVSLGKQPLLIFLTPLPTEEKGSGSASSSLTLCCNLSCCHP